jgi:hypothetical protein
MRGRKPKPTMLKVLSGNPGKRKLNRGEPIAAEIPDYTIYGNGLNALCQEMSKFRLDVVDRLNEFEAQWRALDRVSRYSAKICSLVVAEHLHQYDTAYRNRLGHASRA